jgi:hypothetical protein
MRARSIFLPWLWNESLMTFIYDTNNIDPEDLSSKSKEEVQVVKSGSDYQPGFKTINLEG